MRRRARTDATAKDLTQLARELGAKVVLINGVIDALIYWRSTWYVVDFKSKGGSLTPAQQRMVIDGLDVKFISTADQLKALLGVEG